MILPPHAPAFYNENSVTDIPPDIASAVVHVKNTLNRDELRDAMRRVHVVNDGDPRYRAAPQRERERLPSAIVALGSDWKGGFQSALTAFGELIASEFAPTHPSQIPGFIGTPDWDILNYTFDMGVIPPEYHRPYQLADAPVSRTPRRQAGRADALGRTNPCVRSVALLSVRRVRPFARNDASGARSTVQVEWPRRVRAV